MWRREGREQNLQISVELSSGGNGMENADPWFLSWLRVGGAVSNVQRVAPGRGWHVPGCLMEAAFGGQFAMEKKMSSYSQNMLNMDFIVWLDLFLKWVCGKT